MYKNEKRDLDLTRIEKKLNKNVNFGRYQVFLINKDYIIEKASLKNEIGFDLGKFEVIKNLFNKLYEKKILIDISSPKIDSDSRLKRYLIKLSDDEKYILQIAFSLDYNNEIKEQFDYLISDSTKINLYIATEFFIQEIDFKSKNFMKIDNFLEYCKISTKNFLSEINLALKNKDIKRLSQIDLQKEKIGLNRELTKILPLNKELVSYVNKSQNSVNFFSSTGSLFGESSDTILFIKTSFPLETLDKNLRENRNTFIFVVVLVFLILAIFEYFRRREVALKIITITKKIQNHEMIENESSIFKDISVLINSYNQMLKKLNTQIKINKEISYVDSLTKIKNRKAYDEKLKELVNLYKRYKTIFSIAILDIDDFKKVNDTYGHSVGDVALKDMAQVLKSSIRSSDMLYRIGGEEFVVIFPNTTLAKSKVVIEEIRKKVKNDFKVAENDTLTLSIGITEINSKDSEDSIFGRIDTFLYQSKNNGKDKVISD
jgi:diguanylate cyclase (GGDEF)-like protein